MVAALIGLILTVFMGIQVSEAIGEDNFKLLLDVLILIVSGVVVPIVLFTHSGRNDNKDEKHNTEEKSQ